MTFNDVALSVASLSFIAILVLKYARVRRAQTRRLGVKHKPVEKPE